MAQLQTLLRRPNLLQYPGTLPGFDPSHVASQGMSVNNGFSATCTASGRFVDALTGFPSTVLFSSPTSQITGIIGPTRTYGPSDGDATGGSQFSGAVSAQTYACIVHINSVGAPFQSFISNENPNIILITGANFGMYGESTGGVSFGIPATTDYYFYAISMISSNVNFVIKNLSTGSVSTGSHALSGITTACASGLYCIGNNDGGAQGARAAIAAAMVGNNNYLSIPQLFQWAQDPWSFWYPQKFDFGTMLQSSPPVVVPSLGMLGLADAEW